MNPEVGDAAPAGPQRPIRVVGLVYLVTRHRVRAAIVEHGAWHWTSLIEVRHLLTAASALRDELSDTVAVARRRLPRLGEFVRGWGRELVPAEVLQDPPDVLVLVPHALLHQLPLHLVQADDGVALACHSGVAYNSSLSMFCRSAARNDSRWSTWGNVRPAKGGGTDVLGTNIAEFRALAAEALAEVTAARTATGTELFRGRYGRFHVKQVLQAANNAVICIVAHGYVDPERHRDSGLLLDMLNQVAMNRRLHLLGGEWEIPDRPMGNLPPGLPAGCPAEVLTLADLELGGPTDAQLTLLLACSAGTSQILQGDEPASLAEALLRLGSASVVAPMWDCDYNLAAVWVRAFLQAWKSGTMPKALAVRAAFRTLGTGADPAALGPLHLRGDWR